MKAVVNLTKDPDDEPIEEKRREAVKAMADLTDTQRRPANF